MALQQELGQGIVLLASATLLVELISGVRPHLPLHVAMYPSQSVFTSTYRLLGSLSVNRELIESVPFFFEIAQKTQYPHDDENQHQHKVFR